MKKVSLTLVALSHRDENMLLVITDLCSKHQSNIVACQLTSFDDLHSTSMMVSGEWHNIAKLEDNLKHLSDNTQTQIFFQRVPEKETNKVLFLPYMVFVFGVDQPGIAHKILQFFKTQDVVVAACRGETYLSEANNTPVCNYQFSIEIPGDSSIANFRDQFYDFTENMNLDCRIEPETR